MITCSVVEIVAPALTVRLAVDDRAAVHPAGTLGVRLKLDAPHEPLLRLVTATANVMLVPGTIGWAGGADSVTIGGTSEQAGGGGGGGAPAYVTVTDAPRLPIDVAVMLTPAAASVKVWPIARPESKKLEGVVDAVMSSRYPVFPTCGVALRIRRPRIGDGLPLNEASSAIGCRAST